MSIMSQLQGGLYMAGQEGSNNNKCEFQYKRPRALKKMFPNTDYLFEPQVVSLGPVYHKKIKKWQVTKKDKREIKKVLAGNKAGVFGSDEMKNALDKARGLYERKKLNKMNPDDFNEMMILDACFIIHVIDYITKGERELLDKRPHLLPLILEDMFLLENQVPIIVLEAAMKVLGRDPKDINEFVEKIAQPPEGTRTFSEKLILLVLLVMVLPLSLILLVLCLPLGLVWVMCRACCCAKPQGGNGNENQVDLEQQKKKGSNENKEREPSHNENQVDPKQQKKDSNENEESNLLGLLSAHLLSFSKKNQHAPSHDNMWLHPRRATELTDAGIKFHRSTTSSVTFKQGVIHGHLFLPSLAQLTKTRLVNLMAYELCQVVGGYGMITSYVSFLDGLIDFPKDVKELRSTQILPKALGDDHKVTDFFNTVGTLSSPSLYYNNVLKDIESHCQSRWRPSTAKFWDNHIVRPWTTVSFLIAIFLYVKQLLRLLKTFLV